MSVAAALLVVRDMIRGDSLLVADKYLSHENGMRDVLGVRKVADAVRSPTCAETVDTLRKGPTLSIHQIFLHLCSHRHTSVVRSLSIVFDDDGISHEQEFHGPPLGKWCSSVFNLENLYSGWSTPHDSGPRNTSRKSLSGRIQRQGISISSAHVLIL